MLTDPHGLDCRAEYRECVAPCATRNNISGCIRLCRIRYANCLRREDPKSDASDLLRVAAEFGVEKEVENAIRAAENFRIYTTPLSVVYDPNDENIGGGCGESAEDIYDAVRHIDMIDGQRQIHVFIGGCGTGMNLPRNRVHNWVEIHFHDHCMSPRHRTFIIDNGAIGGKDHVGSIDDKDFFIKNWETAPER
jgi:hypothetical protein